ncbi:hypothetical protein SEA_NICEHOUSE_264 [Rhodococcus phage NiceHouse]|nr:hypothetical protein SEA_NICEHOUSE_264 [Rhodococcus phage NiceHouse]
MSSRYKTYIVTKSVDYTIFSTHFPIGDEQKHFNFKITERNIPSGMTLITYIQNKFNDLLRVRESEASDEHFVMSYVLQPMLHNQSLQSEEDLTKWGLLMIERDEKLSASDLAAFGLAHPEFYGEEGECVWWMNFENGIEHYVSLQRAHRMAESILNHIQATTVTTYSPKPKPTKKKYSKHEYGW